MPDDTYPIKIQHFEVVIMRNEASELSATQDDFRRVAVVAKDLIAALMDPAVLAACGAEWRPIVATPPGVATGPEMMARRRALDADGVKQRTNW